MKKSRIAEFVIPILAELIFAIGISVISPFFVRYFVLPSSVHRQYPLNVVFQTCDHDLHSVCSFPSATLEYEKNQVFSPKVMYYLNIQLKFADVSTSNRLGFFQNVISTHDENGNQLRKYIKAAYVKEPGFLTKVTWIIFFPLYFLGFFHDYSVLNIAMSADYTEVVGKESVKMVYTLQDKFANIEEAYIIVTARFGFIRHILYYWPTISYLIIFFIVFTIILMIIIAKFAYFNLKKDGEQTIKDELQTPSIGIEKQIILKKKKGFDSDEYAPDNVNEVPRNEVLLCFGKMENAPDLRIKKKKEI